MISGSDAELGALTAAAWSLVGPRQDLDTQVAWAPNTRSSSLPFRQECLLSEPEVGEGCPLEAEGTPGGCGRKHRCSSGVRSQGVGGGVWQDPKDSLKCTNPNRNQYPLYHIFGCVNIVLAIL